MIALLGILASALAIDVNDQVELELAGGEVVSGWFVRSRPGVVTMHVPTLGSTVDVDLTLVNRTILNGKVIDADTFHGELDGWYSQWSRWIENTPKPPSPASVAVASIPLAGTGHAWLGDWRVASGMMVADALGMGVFAWELKNKQRLNVVSGAFAVSVVMKVYAATNGVREAKLARKRRGEYLGR